MTTNIKTDADTARHPTEIYYKGLLFGVELEIESPGLYCMQFNGDDEEPEEVYPDLPPGWQLMEEHSIDGPELASDRPYSYDTTVANIEGAFRDIARQGGKPIRTCRGSTHVHVNCQDLTWGQMRKTVLACAWAEELLIERAGKGRKGNLFAMSYRTAPLGWADIINSVRERKFRLYRDTHYMAVNFSSLTNLGTIEFRMPPSARNAEDAIEWLTYIKDVAEAGRQEGSWLWNAEFTHPMWLNGLLSDIPELRREGVLKRARAQAEAVTELLERDWQPPINRPLNPCSEMLMPMTAHFPPLPMPSLAEAVAEAEAEMQAFIDSMEGAEPTPPMPVAGQFLTNMDAWLSNQPAPQHMSAYVWDEPIIPAAPQF